MDEPVPDAPALPGIPRPAFSWPGAPAPWAAVPAVQRRGLTVVRVLDALGAAGLGGRAPAGVDDVWVSDELAGVDRPPARSVASAVLVALFEEGGEARVVLTRRSAELRLHRGEVSFPGGRLDPGETPTGAALREAAEEVALQPALVSVAGWLHPVRTFVSGSLIMPVVGVLPTRPLLQANPAEVARVFDVALAELVAEGVFHEERWRPPGPALRSDPEGAFPVWFFAAAGETIWGATARMLVELLAVTLAATPAAPGAVG